MKPTLKAPISARLKLKCDDLLSNFAFSFNLRRYVMADSPAGISLGDAINLAAGAYTGPSLFQLNLSAFCGIGGAFGG